MADSTRSPEIFVMQVLTFRSTSSPSTTEFCVMLNAKRCRDQLPTVFLMRIQQSKQLMKRPIHAQKWLIYWFTVRNWITNSHVVVIELSFNQPFTDTIRCLLLGSKTKVAPNKPISVSRMELLAAILGAKFLNMLNDVHTLNFKNDFYRQTHRLCWNG